MAAARARSSRGTRACASTIGARRFTSSARSTSSHREGLEAPRTRAARRWRRGCRPRPPRPASRATSARSARSTASARAAELGGQRLEHVDAPTRQDQRSRRGRRAPARSRGRCPPLAPVSSTVEPAICTSCEPIRDGVIALFGPTGVGKTAVAVALARLLRARGEDPVAVSADALQVYAGLETLTGAATPAEQAQLEHRLVSFLPRRRDLQRRPVRAARPRRDRRAARRRAPADRRRRHRPVPARGADRARPAPAAARGGARALDGRARTRAARRRCTRGSPNARRGRPRRSSRTTASGSCARSSCSSSASSSRRRGPRSSGASELRHPTLLVGLTMEREELYAAIDAPRGRDGRRRARARRCCGRHGRGVSETASQGARLRGAARRRRRADEAAHAQLRTPPADLDAQARRACT